MKKRISFLYLFSLIDELFDCFIIAPLFIKIDIKNVYLCFLIQKDDNLKTYFQIRDKPFEYVLMIIEVRNKPFHPSILYL